MTLTDLLPVRLGWRERPLRKHRAPDEIERLQRKVAGAELLIKGLHVQLDDKDRAHEATSSRQAEAELLVVQLRADLIEAADERDEWKAEALRLRARFGPQLAAEANANRVDVPCGYRDTSAIEDQATGPIDVKPLWEALDIHYAERDAASPAHVPAWAVADDLADALGPTGETA